MIRRLAVVIWWVGATALLSALGIAAHHQLKIQECQPILAENVEMARRENEAMDKARTKAETKAKAEGRSELGLMEAIDVAESGILPRPPGFDEQLAKCEGAQAKEPFILAGIVAALGVCAFVVAFVLGGSFFAPPKAR